MNEWRNGRTHTLFYSLKHLRLPLPRHHVQAQSPQCGLDPSHSDSGCSPFEKLNGGPFGRVKWGPQEKNMLSSAQLLQSQSQRRRLARWCNGRRRAAAALAEEESSSAQPY